MAAVNNQQDLQLSQKICDDLNAGQTQAIDPLYQKYQFYFVCFAKRRLFVREIHQAESVCNDFWGELLDGKVICTYANEKPKGKKASLRTYLITRLNWRIRDHNKKTVRDRQIFTSLDDNADDIETDTHDGETPEKSYIRKEISKIILQALLMLSENAPRDAHLIRMRLEGLSYHKMAERALEGTGYDDDALAKKTNAIKKQFTRTRTGSMAKFKICLERSMTKNKINQEDIIRYLDNLNS